MSQSEIDAVRVLLGSKPRPVGWHQRRQRIEEVGAVWPAASDVKFEEVDIAGLRGEWTIAPGSGCFFTVAVIAPAPSSAIAGWSPKPAGPLR